MNTPPSTALHARPVLGGGFVQFGRLVRSSGGGTTSTALEVGARRKGLGVEPLFGQAQLKLPALRVERQKTVRLHRANPSFERTFPGVPVPAAQVNR
jgi:hypothetical protein